MYVFESLVADHRQILITSDTYPKELANIDNRLVSRFNSGLIVAIEPPELPEAPGKAGSAAAAGRITSVSCVVVVEFLIE